jgi:hypothetical protein
MALAFCLSRARAATAHPVKLMESLISMMKSSFLAMNYNFSIFHFASLPAQTNFPPLLQGCFSIKFFRAISLRLKERTQEEGDEFSFE